MSSMCARNGLERSHTRATLLFIVPHLKPTVMCKRGSSAHTRTVRALGPDGPRVRRGRRKVAGGAWISLPGGTPSGRRDPRGCLGSGRPT